MNVVTSLSAILFLATAVSASASGSLCRQAADAVQIGGAASPSLLDGLEAVVEAKQEDDAPAVLRKWNAEPDLLQAAQDLTDDGMIRSSVDWLVPDRLGAVDVVGGTAHCQSLLFLRVVDGKAVSIPAPKDVPMGMACWGDSVWLGTIAGTPYAIELNNGLGDRGRSIVASAWSGASWQPKCSLIETYSVVLKVENRFCRPGIDCLALEAIALDHARAAQAEHEEATPAIGPDGQTDPTRQIDPTATKLPDAIPTFVARSTNPDTAFADRRSFQTSYMGQQIVGIIGGGHIGWRDYDGWLVAFWQASGNGYDPLAGLQISRHLGVVRSLDVQDPR